jgi:hypothetical protein
MKAGPGRAINTSQPLTNPPLKRSSEMAKTNNTLTQARLKELLHYDPETGVFTWRVTRSRTKAGSVAGTVKGDGYLSIGISRKYYRTQRLAWFYVYGVWPDGVIDHINRDIYDNRIANLRDVSVGVNAQNLAGANRRSSTGLLGVRRVRKPNGDKFQAAIRVDGAFHYLGCFGSPEEAHSVYIEAKARLHEGYVNHAATSN